MDDAVNKFMDMITENANVYLNFESLNDLKGLARRDTPEALRQVAEQFEGIFVRMMLKSMREASVGDPIFDDETTKFYQSMMDDQLALDLSKNGTFGIADHLVKQFNRYVQPTDEPSAVDSDKNTTASTMPLTQYHALTQLSTLDPPLQPPRKKLSVHV